MLVRALLPTDSGCDGLVRRRLQRAMGGRARVKTSPQRMALLRNHRLGNPAGWCAPGALPTELTNRASGVDFQEDVRAGPRRRHCGPNVSGQGYERRCNCDLSVGDTYRRRPVIASRTRDAGWREDIVALKAVCGGGVVIEKSLNELPPCLVRLAGYGPLAAKSPLCQPTTHTKQNNLDLIEPTLHTSFAGLQVEITGRKCRLPRLSGINMYID
jgi:hypothetical protein